MLPTGQAAALTFIYDGKLTGNEESPVFGIKFAAIHPDFAYFMYPARWFPVSGYTTDRFSSDLKVTVPTGYRVVASGIDTERNCRHRDDRDALSASTSRRSREFRGREGRCESRQLGRHHNVFVPAPDRRLWPRNTATRSPKPSPFSPACYGAPYKRNLTVIETEDGTPNGYSRPALLFLSPHGIGKQVNTRPGGERSVAAMVGNDGFAERRAITPGSKTGWRATPSCCTPSTSTERRARHGCPQYLRGSADGRAAAADSDPRGWTIIRRNSGRRRRARAPRC